MSILRILAASALLTLPLGIRAQDDLDKALVNNSAEQKVQDAIKSPELSVVHLWAPWCSNCQVELKSGGWLKMVKDNPHVKFYFVSVWNDGGDGKSMLQKFQIADQPNVAGPPPPPPRPRR